MMMMDIDKILQEVVTQWTDADRCRHTGQWGTALVRRSMASLGP